MSNSALEKIIQRPLEAANTDLASQFRQPPTNMDAEQGLLGAILVNNAAYERVSDFLMPEHFAYDAHRRVYSACRHLIEHGHIANPITLKNYFEQDNQLDSVGGARYLAKLATVVTHIVNVRDYGRAVHDLYLRRQLITLGEDMVNEAFTFNIEHPATKQIERSEQCLFDLATQGDVEGGFKSFADVSIEAVNVAEAAYKRSGTLTGLSTGLADLDNLLGGLSRSDLLILAGRPSMGKTALATNIAFQIARTFRQEPNEFGEKKTADGGVVGFFSLEMSAEQLVTRILAEQASIGSEKIRRGMVTQTEINNIIRVNSELSRIPLYIDDTPGLTVSALRTRARRLKRQYGLDMIVVDYLQLIQGSNRSISDGRVQEISEITRGLKTLAKELDVPVIALSQLSRAVEQREDKRPQLSDLRESGSIEQDADIVMFVYRQAYYMERLEPQRRDNEDEREFMERYQQWQTNLEAVTHIAEVIIAKQRHGPIGNVKLYFDGATTKFSNLADSQRLPASH